MSQSKRRAASHAPRVLLIDDDPGFVELIRGMLEERGYEVITPFFGAQENILLDAFEPDIILLDVWLFQKKSNDIARRFKRAISQHPENRVPLVLISSSPELPEISKEVKADAFLSKPFDPEMMFSLVEKYHRVTPS